MKSKLKFFLLTLVLGLITVNFGYAQSFPDFTSASDTGIALESDNPLTEKYEMDFSNYGWTEKDASLAANYLDEKSSLISLAVDFSSQKLILTLDLNAPAASGWNLHDWNDHLESVR